MKFIDSMTGEILESIKLNEYIAVGVFDGDVMVIKKEEEYLHYAFEYSLDREDMSYDEFLENCLACGGNWSNMILSGIRAIFPNVYDAMPDREYSFIELIEIIEMCGVKIEKEG